MRLETPAQHDIAAELDAFFGQNGDVVRKFGGQSRWSQMEMALAVSRGFHQQSSLLLEAPTGTGKTLAYLIPIALHLRRHSKARFVIAVATKHLQAQIDRELVRLAETFPELNQSHVLKGANNYLCLNRLKRASQRRQVNARVTDEIHELLGKFADLERMAHGWREELPFQVSDQTWTAINSEGACCRSVQGCFRRQARKLAAKARIVVVNTDLLGYNIKFTGQPVPTDSELTEKPILVLDEAHTLLARLCEVESADVSLRTLENAARLLTRECANNNLLRPRVLRITEQLDETRKAILPGPEGQTVVCPEDPTAVACRNLTVVVKQIKDMATLLRKQAPSEEVSQDYQEIESRLGFAGQTLASYLDGRLSNHVLLLNRSTSLNGHTALNLELKPFELGEALGRLWAHFSQCTLVSATLIGTSIPETKRTFNAKDWEVTNFPTPFNYRTQMRLHIPPKQRDRSTPEGIAETIHEVASRTDGRVMALFTNYKAIAEVQQMICDWCHKEDYQLYVQERNISPETIVEKYLENPRAIILGNQSMGTGVDIRLRALIITKIPFDQQTPYREARQRYLEKKGVNPFRDDTLPETVRKWKQWWGRLIRQENQRGLLVLLDPKLNTANYSHYFLNSLPKEIMTSHLDDPSAPMPDRKTLLQWFEAPQKMEALSLA